MHLCTGSLSTLSESIDFLSLPDPGLIIDVALMDLSRLYMYDVCSMYSLPLSNFSAVYVRNPIGQQCTQLTYQDLVRLHT